jgi:hypothetical protein
MAAAYDSVGNVNPAFASDINNWCLAMTAAAVAPSPAALQAASSAISTDAVTGIASSSVAN